MKQSISILVGVVLLFGVITSPVMAATTDNDTAAVRAALMAQVLELMQILETLLAEQKAAEMTNVNNPVAQIETNYGTIELELFTDVMPITTDNFMELATSDFYDGTQFHRVIAGFMIQGGDPNTKTNDVLRYGTGGPGYTIPDEHVVDEKLTNVRGTIAMANAGPQSGGSQFFINVVDNKNLDFDKQPLVSQHPVFGKVISGMNVVDKIAAVETSVTDLPVTPVVVSDIVITSLAE
jgi:peptidylprolyl isomerase